MPQGRGKTKPAKQEKAQEPFGIVLQIEDGTYRATPQGGMAPMAIPTHLRAAANALEKALIDAA